MRKKKHQKSANQSAYLLLLLFALMTLDSCRDYNSDDDEISDKEKEAASQDGTRFELTQDSILLYSQEIYYWYDQLPTYTEFDPRSFDDYSDDLSNLEEELYYLSQYAINPETGEPYEYLEGYSVPKYSFIEESDDAEDSGSAALAISYLEGQDDDYGFALTAIAADDIRVRYVTRGSAAYEAGLRRGDQFIEVNGQTVSAASQSDVNLINAAFDGDTFNFTILQSDTIRSEITLVRETYNYNPVFKDTVLESNQGKVGYLAYELFSSLDSSEEPLAEAFEKFAEDGVKDLILDLRYNGGGYVATAEFLANSIIPSSLTGELMYIEKFNDKMQAGEATILENQLLTDSNGDYIPYRNGYANYNDIDYSESANSYDFSKEGSLEGIENLYVIMSGNTASSSELVINSLRPYLNVTLIGSTSYGKPVGFFGIDIDTYTLYVPNFETVNSEGEGNYFAGFEPDYEVSDDVTRDFGDPEESCIATALALSSGVQARIAQSLDNGFDRVSMGQRATAGTMIEQRRTLR